MLNQKLGKLVLLIAFCVLGTGKCYAEGSQEVQSPIKTLNTNEVQPSSSEVNINLSQNVTEDVKKVYLSKTDAFSASENATDKFVQCNIRNAWEDFRNVIKTTEENDFIYMTLASKMAGLGLFDLSSLAQRRMQDKAITALSTDATRRFYYPKKRMKLEDELFLAEVYSNIMFNNQSSEATAELMKKDSMLANYDYANYLMALGSYKSNFNSRAAKYINIALIQNPSNLNYNKLKAEILAEDGKVEESLKIVDFLKKQNLYSYEYERKINSAEQFVLYKTSKNQWEKDYHLGFYHFIESDSSRAVRTLQDALGQKHVSNKALILGLLSEIYFTMDEFEKASDTALKAHKIDSSNPKALMTLGDLSYRSGNYKQALDYFKKAAAKDKKSYTLLVKQGQTYQKLNNSKKAIEIYEKVLKNYSDSWEAYYNVALLEPDKTEIYLKKAIAINPLFVNGWVELAKVQIDKADYNLAQKYLSNAFYIDENNFKYYYYQGLICQNSGDYLQAKYNFKKCLKLNSGFTDAKTALESIFNRENNININNFNQEKL